MISPEIASKALVAGWDRNVLLELRDVLEANGWLATDVTSFGIIIHHRLVIYQHRIESSIKSLKRRLSRGVSRHPVRVYTDGSGNIKDKPAGIGVVVAEESQELILIPEHIGLGTNNHAELMAIWRGIQEVPDRNVPIIVHTDSEYAIGACGTNAVKANHELIYKIRDDLAWRGNVKFQHVRGHNGDPYNELCDLLAGWARRYGGAV